MPASPKQRIVAMARQSRLLPLLERGRFLLAVARASADNSAFIKANPNFVPPPLWWMHDMYSHASYKRYLRTGAETAAALAKRIDARVLAVNPRVADWGCGLARVTRHMPERYRLTGFDYNAAAVAWCTEHIAGAAFRKNGLAPPLPAENAAFDALYALSVFTHLSEEGHAAWIAEIERVLAPGGVFLGTFHAAPAAGQLLPAEQVRFDAGDLVVRGGVLEGGRTYTAFHPERYLRERLFRKFDILEGPAPFFGQSLFAARKR